VNPGYSYPYAFLPHPISFNSFLLSWWLLGPRHVFYCQASIASGRIKNFLAEFLKNNNYPLCAP
jgi:hypothetical protein